RYIAHEFLNQEWHPMMFSDIAGEMLEAKCRYVGSATLTENIDSVSVPPGVATILGETRDQFVREMLRDIGCSQTFRRDIYRKGIAPMPPAEQQMGIETMTFVSLGQPVPEAGVTFSSPIGTVTGRPEIYQPLLAMLDEGPVSVRQAKESPAFATR